MPEGGQEPQCAYCGKALEVDEAVVLLMPNRPIRRVWRRGGEDLPADGIAVHERCYEERLRSVGG